MAHRDELERYEATEAQDLTRLLCALRPPARAEQVPPDVDLTIRAAIWQTSVRRQVATLLAMARRDLIRVIRQALAENPLLEEASRAADEDAPAGDLTDAAAQYDSMWQACVPDDWDADEFTAPMSDGAGTSAWPSNPSEALVADVIVTKVEPDYQVVLHEADMPRLRLRATDGRQGPEGPLGEPAAMPDLDDHLRAAVWLIRSLEYRRQTLDKVAQHLMARQRAFLDHGLAHLQPLALTEVAAALGLHASTLRCVITNTYLSMADGIIALTAFFPRGVASSAGEPWASRTVHQTPPRSMAGGRTRLQPVRQARARRSPLFCPACGTPRPEPWRGVPCRACGSVDPIQEPMGPSGARLAPDEEERVRQILEDPAHLAFRQAWLHSRPTVPDPMAEMRQAFHDLQTALAHPQLRPAVLLALRAFAQAAQAGAPTSLPAAAAEPGPHLPEPPRPDERKEAPGVPPEVEAAQRHRYLAWFTSRYKSPKMQEVARLVEQALQSTVTVLLTGERGTGKSHLARLLHHQGPRAKGPFITVNCAALPDTRLEAELFGDERGAFPGATQGQPGCLERATGGTLVLEDIDALSPMLQAKLLRVLHAQQFARVGGTETVTTDARIVATTHHDLDGLSAAGRFRRDLFYRLNVYPIAVPPLRERPEDIGPLTGFCLMRFRQKWRNETLGISQEALAWLARYPWPGNLRELEEVIEQAVARCQSPTVTVQDLPQSLLESSHAPASSGEAVTLPLGGIALADLEQQLIRQALDQAHQNMSHAAKLLGLSRTQLRTRMRRYGLEDH